MLTTIYKNESGVIDKVVLTSQGVDDSNELLDFAKRYEPAPPPEAQGSGYTHGWDKGFAQDGDPYGIQAEYLPQSANTDAAAPEPAHELVAFYIQPNEDGTFALTENNLLVGNFPTREDAEAAEKLARDRHK